jgi:hypothetical protein
MAGKLTGLGDNFYIGGYDLSGDVNSLGPVHGGPAALDFTGIKKSAYERQGGLRDGGMDFATFMNADTAAAHAALSPLPTADVIATYFNGTVVGNAAASCNGKQVNYDWNRGNDGSLMGAVSVTSDQFGLEWGTQLTAGLRTDATATTGTAFDNLAAGSNGAQAYLQVTAFTGTDVTIKVRHCATSGGTYADLIAFSAVTAAQTAQRGTATGTVNEFFKVVTSTSGGFTSVSFAVMIVVNQTAVTF